MSPDDRDDESNERLSTADLAGRSSIPSAEDALITQGRDADGQEAPLFPDDEARDLKARWDGIQASFVDHPREAVQEADGLVASAMKRLAEQFADERSGLEAQWDRGDDVSTEDLRLTLQRYRSFFARLLSV